MALIPCFDKTTIEGLRGQFKKLVNENMSEGEQRELGKKLGMDYHKQLHGEMETLKKKINPKYKPQSYINQPDKTAEIEKVKSEYQTKIDEENKKNELPITEKKTSPTDESVNKVVEPTGEGGKKPPIDEGNGIYVEPKRTILSHRGLQEVATEFGLEDVTPRDRVSDMELHKKVEIEQNDLVKSGKYGEHIEGLITKAENGEALNAEQRLLLQNHLANVREKTAKGRIEHGINSPEYDKQLQELNRLKEAGQKVRSTAGAALRIPGIASIPDNTLEGWMNEKMESSGTDVLTDKQKEDVQKQHSEYEEKLKKSDELLAKAHSEIATLKAEAEIRNANKKAARKKDRSTLKVEREDILTSIKEKWKGAGKTTLQSDIPYRQQLAAIAPDVAKLTRNLVETGVSKLADVIDNIHEVLKEISPEIKKEDVRDLIAGVYNEKKPSKSAIQRAISDVRDEAKLAKKLSDLLNGEEPKSEKEKVSRNSEIKKLREQVKSIAGFSDEISKNEKAALSKKAIKNKEKERELIKAEKESDLSDKKKEDAKKRENERKRKEAEAETKKLEKEFENEKKEEAKKLLKYKIDAAKKLSDELDFRTPEEKSLETIIKRNEYSVKKLEERISNKDFETEKPIPFDENAALKKANPQLYKEAFDAIVAKEEARHKFDLAKRQDELDKRSKIKKSIYFGAKLISTSKAIKAGIDDSVTFVQLGMSILANPRSGLKAKIEAFKDINDRRFKRQLAALHESPAWNTIKSSGLDITEPKSLTKENVEELYSGNLLDQPIKGVNLWTYTGGIFERLFTSMGNNMRLNLFLKRMEYLQNQGMTFDTHPKEYKDAARVINELTGRGKTHPSLQAAMPVISPIIWAPKMLSSTINTLGLNDIAYALAGKKGYYRNLTKEQQKYAGGQMAKGIGMGIAIMTVAGVSGWTVDYDPRSSTFGSIKNGTTTYNVFGRYSGLAKILVQISTGTKETSYGEQDLDAKGGRGAVLGKFFRGKMTPFSGEAYDYIFNSKTNSFTKEPINLQSIPDDLITPISANDFTKGLEQDGSISLLTRFLPAVEGIQVMDDRDFKNTHLFTKEEIESQEFKPLKEKGVNLPSMGTVKTHKIDVDENHPNQAKEGEEPYGVMSDDEFKKFNDIKKKYFTDEVKKMLNKKWNVYVESPTGKTVSDKYVLGKDLDKKELQSKVQTISGDANKIAKEKMKLVKQKNIVTVEEP